MSKKKNSSSQKEKNDVVAYRKTSHAKTSEDGQGWEETTINDTLNAFDTGEARTPTVITQAICIGNGQLHDALSPSEEVCKTLNCMEDPMKIITKKVVQEKTYGIDQQGGKGMAGYTEDVAPTLAGDSHGTPHGVCYGVEETPNKKPNKHISNCMSIDGYNQSIEMEIHPALRTGKDSVDAYNQTSMEDKMHTMRYCGGNDAIPITCYSVENRPQDSRIKINEQGICQTLDARMGMGGGNVPMVMEEEKEIGEQTQMIVRRLTPLECERLQGFPDGWTDIGDWVDSKGKTHKGESDSPRYKALGNSIAIPFWQWMAGRIVAQYDRPTTMGSLFSGIGGFELAYARAGCMPLWNSEIEEFPEAVTTKHFGDEEKGIVGDYEQYL